MPDPNGIVYSNMLVGVSKKNGQIMITKEVNS